MFNLLVGNTEKHLHLIIRTNIESALCRNLFCLVKPTLNRSLSCRSGRTYVSMLVLKLKLICLCFSTASLSYPTLCFRRLVQPSEEQHF